MDRMTKLLLAFIGLGLWANAVLPVLAQDWSDIENDLSSIESSLNSIESDISSLSGGVCVNSKLC